MSNESHPNLGQGDISQYQTELPRVGPRELVYENKYQHIYRVEAQFDEFNKEYFVNDTGVKAGIVVVREESVLLIRQYRLLINGMSWEIPGGKVDEGESPGAAEIRECLEETGVRCLEALPLIFYHPGLDTLVNPTHIFYANRIEPKLELQGIHSQEVSGSEWVPFSRCIEMISNQQILDSFSILSLLAYRAYGSGS